MKWIVRMREDRSWTQGHLAKRSEVSERTIQRMESGDPKAASPETLRSITEAFGISIPLNSPEGRVWLALVEHADANREVTSTWAELHEWLGPEAFDFDPHEAAIHLYKDGYFRGQPLFEGGPDGAFNVTLRL